MVLRNQDLVVRCAHYNGLSPSFSLLVASLTLRNTALISHNICTYTYENIHICVSELLTYAPVRKDLLRITLYVYGFLFLPLALQEKYYFAKLFTLVLLFPKSFMPGYIIYL